MSQNGAEASKSPSAGRPRHQITRSISEISSPISRLHRHNSNRVLKDRERETLSPVVQSTVPGPQGRRSFEVPRFEGVTPNGSPNGSRRTSILYNSADDVMPGILGGSPQKASGGPTTATQQKAIARKSGLQRSLVELEAFAGSTTARLNDTYYSVLEKLGTLQNTVSALKELAELSGQINNTFSTDADGLFDDFSSQLDSLGHFEDQQERILSLQGRIHTGRENIRLLSERVDVVRERIENWERAERVWQEKTRKRLKAVWVISIIAALLLILLFIMAKYASESLDVTAANLANDKAGLGNHGRSEPNSEISKTETADRVLNWTGPSESSSSLANEVLRAFDEL
ncbi:hypothetical protein QBC38DRAFT_515888 [Podospora fimiseda]|uniref:Uncharacterized protein n=1 Tax=Podospora fimiseda TaxID=252190 RepID=A0AAN7BVW6_9PEZI|nr:hypothetical protein QBC38DRAFT_515888 [Podospora fimiseda]